MKILQNLNKEDLKERLFNLMKHFFKNNVRRKKQNEGLNNMLLRPVSKTQLKSWSELQPIEFLSSKKNNEYQKRSINWFFNSQNKSKNYLSTTYNFFSVPCPEKKIIWYNFFSTGSIQFYDSLFKLNFSKNLLYQTNLTFNKLFCKLIPYKRYVSNFHHNESNQVETISSPVFQG